MTECEKEKTSLLRSLWAIQERIRQGKADKKDRQAEVYLLKRLRALQGHKSKGEAQ